MRVWYSCDTAERLDFHAGATRILRHGKPATPLLGAGVRARGGVAARAVQRIRTRRRSELLPVLFQHPALRLVQPGRPLPNVPDAFWSVGAGVGSMRLLGVTEAGFVGAIR